MDEISLAPHLAHVSTYPPKRCGLASFADALDQALEPLLCTVPVPVLDGGDEPGVIVADDPRSYLRAAVACNVRADAVLLHHEFGIFGGESGAYVLGFAEELTVPLVTVLHTVKPDLSATERAVLGRVIELSAAVVVLCEPARRILERLGHGHARIVTIPHGAPLVRTTPLAVPRSARPTVLSFGLLGPGKGIELVLDALPAVVDKVPDVRYVWAGATHPRVIQAEGERYRLRLGDRVRALGLEDHVVLWDEYLTAAQLRSALGAGDVLVTPYPNRTQISSGPLTFGFAARVPCVATPFPYALDLLGGERGHIVETTDEVAGAIITSLTDDDATERLLHRGDRRRAAMGWPRVGARYAGLVRAVLEAGHAPVARALP